MVVLMARLMDHIELVGPLTYELSHAPFPSEGSHGIKGNASYICTIKKQPTSASTVSGNVHSIQARRCKNRSSQMQ